MKVYLAGPIGHPEDNGAGWREAFSTAFGHRAEFLNPLDRYSPEEYDGLPGEEVVEDDKETLDEADGVIVGWDKVPSVGTPMEILYCHERDIPVVVWIEPFGSMRSLEERDLSPWLTYHADGVYISGKDALDALEVEVMDDE